MKSDTYSNFWQCSGGHISGVPPLLPPLSILQIQARPRPWGRCQLWWPCNLVYSFFMYRKLGGSLSCSHTIMEEICSSR